MEESKQNYQYIICPDCQGKGKIGGKTCDHCGGVGLGTFSSGKFHYWSAVYTASSIQINHIRRTFDNIINFLCLLIGIAGFVSLLYWFWTSPFDDWLIGRTGGISDLKDLVFKNQQNQFILFFWLSLLFDLFVYYRMSRAIETRPRIKRVFISKTRSVLPNNWKELKTLINRKKELNVSKYFKNTAITVIENAYWLAKASNHKQVEPVHLFFALFQSRDMVAALSRLNVDAEKIVSKSKNLLLSLPPQEEIASFSPVVKQIFIEAYLKAYKDGLKDVDELNLILPIIKYDKDIAEILYDIEVDYDTFSNVIAWFRINDRLLENYRLYKKMAGFKPGTNMDRAYTAIATPALNQFSMDLTLMAKWGRIGLCIAQDKQINEVFEAWESGKDGVILIGPPGVGKRNLAEGIAQLMVKEDVPKIIRDKRLVELDISRLISGSSAAEAQARLMMALDEVAMAGNIVLYLENVESLMGITSGGEQSLELSDILANFVSKKLFYCLATSTEDNFARYVEARPIGNVLAKLVCNEPEINEAIQILESKIGHLEGKYRVFFTYQSIKQAIVFSQKYIHDKYLPEKAIDVLDAAAVKVLNERGEGASVNKDDIAVVVSSKANIPVTSVTSDESQKLLHLEEKIHERMVGQEEAVDSIAASLRRARAQMREDKRPIASFLFLGPTGVGKTELAKTVAEVYFGQENCMVRIDMSEYQHADSVDKMIGHIDGTLGFLTEAVRRMPFSLLLLDEIEKAHPNILNLFLQVLDDGRLTDGQGRTVDFTNCIIIATSNVGSVYIQEQISAGNNIENIKKTIVNEHLTSVMKPELINRFDGVIVFKPLTMDNVCLIAQLMLKKVAKMLEDKGIGLKVYREGLEKLAQDGFDPKFGARPLRRIIQEKVENQIANKLLAGEMKRRDSVIIDQNGNIAVEKGRVI